MLNLISQLSQLQLCTTAFSWQGQLRLQLHHTCAACTILGLLCRYEGPAPSNFLHVNSQEAFAQAISAERLTVVDFFVPWCVACRRFHPALVKLAAKHPDCTFLAVRILRIVAAAQW